MRRKDAFLKQLREQLTEAKGDAAGFASWYASMESGGKDVRATGQQIPVPSLKDLDVFIQEIAKMEAQRKANLRAEFNACRMLEWEKLAPNTGALPPK